MSLNIRKHTDIYQGGKSSWCHVSSWPEEALQSFASLTAEQREQLRVDKLQEKKEQIARLASAVVSDPHGNVRGLQRVLQVLLPVLLC